MSEAFGLPVTGDVQHYGGPNVEQYPLKRLAPYIQAMLDDKTVTRFGWTQYTPYFNDGEACVFGTRNVFAYIDGEQIDEPGYDSLWDHEIMDRDEKPEHHTQFARAIQSGHYDSALENTFGDPAQVTVTREGIEIAFYEHD